MTFKKILNNKNIKNRSNQDFQKLSSTVQEFLLKLSDEEASARLRDNLLHALHLMQLFYRVLQTRDRNNETLQWTIDHSLSPLTPFREAPDKFEWEWINVESSKLRSSFVKLSMSENFKSLPPIIKSIKEGDLKAVARLVKEGWLNNKILLFNLKLVYL
jgi:hypothetical protein